MSATSRRRPPQPGGDSLRPGDRDTDDGHRCGWRWGHGQWDCPGGRGRRTPRDALVMPTPAPWRGPAPPSPRRLARAVVKGRIDQATADATHARIFGAGDGSDGYRAFATCGLVIEAVAEVLSEDPSAGGLARSMAKRSACWKTRGVNCPKGLLRRSSQHCSNSRATMAKIATGQGCCCGGGCARARRC